MPGSLSNKYAEWMKLTEDKYFKVITGFQDSGLVWRSEIFSVEKTKIDKPKVTT